MRGLYYAFIYPYLSYVNIVKITFSKFKEHTGPLFKELSILSLHDINNEAILLCLCFDLTNRFHVAVRLFSNRSQMTSKCRKNKEVAHEPQASVSQLFLPRFDVLCDLLLNRPTATWNLFVLYNDQKRKRPTHIPASNRLTFWGFVLV